MLLRVASVCLLLAVFIPSISSADDVLDYQKIGPVQIVERIAHTLVEGSGAERRSVTEEAHALGEKYLKRLDKDKEAIEFFSVAGEALIPLFWTSKSTTRARSERILSKFIGDLAPHAEGPGKTKKALSIKLLERYAALMMVSLGNASSGKLLEEIRQVFERAGHEFNMTPATTFTALEGLPNPDPAYGKNIGEKTVAVGKVKEPPPAAPEVGDYEVAPAVAVDKKTLSAQEVTRLVSVEGTQTAPKAASLKRVSARPASATKGTTNNVKRVCASSVTGVGKAMPQTAVVSAKAPRASSSGKLERVSARSRAASSERGSPAALRILNEQLKSEDEARLLSAFGLAERLYEKIRHGANAGVGEERETAQRIIVRARFLVGSSIVSVQKAAISMVAELYDDRSVGQLIRLLSEKQTGVDSVALDALKKLTGEDYGYSIQKWLEWHGEK